MRIKGRRTTVCTRQHTIIQILRQRVKSVIMRKKYGGTLERMQSHGFTYVSVGRPTAYHAQEGKPRKHRE